MNGPAAFAEAALGLVGTPYRLHGRSAATGLDCVGVIAAALRGSGHGCDLPTGYRLRTGEWAGADDWAARNNFGPATGELEVGDVLMLSPGPGQLHLAVIGPDPTKIVEAHAGLRKVVLNPSPRAHAALRRWRLIQIT